MSDESTSESRLTTFLDNIWLQLALTTVITVLWLVWITVEIFFGGLF